MLETIGKTTPLGIVIDCLMNDKLNGGYKLDWIADDFDNRIQDEEDFDDDENKFTLFRFSHPESPNSPTYILADSEANVLMQCGDMNIHHNVTIELK